LCFWREGLEAALGPERMGEKGLLGICFWREGLEAALGPERMGEVARNLLLEGGA